MDNSEANFIKDLDELFTKWVIMLNADIGINGRIEFLNGKLRKNFYFPKGYNGITEKEVKWLPKISKRRAMFDKIKLNEKVHIEDIRPILSAITNVENRSWNYKTDKEFKEMLEALKAKYNLY